jgi:hypothetical protein
LAPASGQGCSAQPAVKVRVETKKFLNIFFTYEEVLIKSAIITTIFAQESADSAVFVSIKIPAKYFQK